MNNPPEITTPTTVLDENRVREALRAVEDPELGCNVIDLGLIYSIAVEGAKTSVQMTLTTQGCPMHESMVEGVRLALLGLEGVQQADVEVVWDPPWNADMMTAEGKAMLGVA
jgi:metal-sulfur cluster biosynthetic enzyme